LRRPIPWRNGLEVNSQVFVGKELYYMSADGHLMPTRKGQPPPDTRYFDKK